jgi:hypothetical protein
LKSISVRMAYYPARFNMGCSIGRDLGAHVPVEVLRRVTGRQLYIISTRLKEML